MVVARQQAGMFKRQTSTGMTVQIYTVSGYSRRCDTRVLRSRVPTSGTAAAARPRGDELRASRVVS